MHASKSRWIPAAVVLGSALLLGSLEATSLQIGMARLGAPISWPDALVRTLPSWLLNAALAWPVWLLSKHARLGPGTWATRLPIHLLACALFVVAAVLGTAVLNRWLGMLGEEPVMAAAVRYFYTFLAYLVAIYWTLVGAFHALGYLRESEHRERERLRLANSLTDAKLNALRSQLSPHFFFNTLNAISTLSLQGRQTQVCEMVGSLGELVRASLDDGLAHEVPLERELELLDLYLDIQRVRFADWLRIDTEIGPGAETMLVPSLVLQPLVENAIEHGLPRDGGIGRVGIRCVLEGGALSIEVENQGQDPPAGALGRLGVGLGNTRERLQHLYPGVHAFSFGPVAGRGFVVTMRIPARRAPLAPAAIGAAR